jgi:TonB-linked SusC/RagA family outer membrane protein
MVTKRLFALVFGVLCTAASASAQQQVKTVTGRVTGDGGAPLSGVAVVIKGTQNGTNTTDQGTYSIRVAPGQVLQFRRIGTSPVERTVGSDNTIDVVLHSVATNLTAVVTTALGREVQARSLGTSQQVVSGNAVAETQRVDFVNALQGRVAGVTVTQTSGNPGASTQITIRGVSSISSSNQPLIVIDGMPVDNQTLNTGAFVAGQSSATDFANRTVDFSNRASDFNPEDIQSVTVLKGPEAAALYGIDAANGAILITTKRGRPGAGGVEYSNDFAILSLRKVPQVQQVYGRTNGDLGAFSYFGAPYAPGTTFYDNVQGFFQDGVTQKHNLTFSGAAPDNHINYRIASSYVNQRGVVPTSTYRRINVTGASQATVTDWLSTDLSLMYTYDNNNQPFKGAGSPLVGLLSWPQNDNAANWLTSSGLRRMVTNQGASSEVDNPYFNVYKNFNHAKTNRIFGNLAMTFTPFKWGNVKTNVGTDYYTGENMINRNPQSFYGASLGGILDQADNVTRNLNEQTLVNINPHHLTKSFSLSGFVGQSVLDQSTSVSALEGQGYLDPNFVSINNTNTRSTLTTISQRRLVSGFGQVTANFRDYLYFNVTGRNDWTSTIPRPRNSFFYPSASASFVFTDAFPALQRFMTGKLRGALAEVGRDAAPYSYAPALQYKPTTGGGYGYNFWGPNPNLKPEFAKSSEIGTELTFLHDRLGIDATYYRKKTTDQIVQNIRGSYATGFVLFNLNGATTENHGVELTLRGTPVQRRNFGWDFVANYDSHHGKVLFLPHNLPESYVSDTWLFDNVRNGTAPGLSTESLTGYFFLRNKKGQLLINPATGLPINSNPNFVNAGFDRTPKYTLGLNNTFRYKKISVSGLLDFRRGGDIYNATEQYLVARGLSMSTLNRGTPIVIPGVLRDGNENSSNPTVNNIVVNPATQTQFFAGTTTDMSDELFIQKNVNWVRLRDITITYLLPSSFAKNASVYVTGTDLWMKTNYTGLDPLTNGNSAAVGGSGGAGIDYGNLPVPRGFNFGIRVGL